MKTKRQKGIYRFLLKYVGKYKIFAFLTPVIVMIETVIEVLIPKCMSNLISQGIGYYDNNGYVGSLLQYQRCCRRDSARFAEGWRLFGR